MQIIKKFFDVILNKPMVIAEPTLSEKATRITDYKQSFTDSSFTKLCESIDNLYNVLSIHPLPSAFTCYDGQRSDSNILKIQTIKNYEMAMIPDELIGMLEFYSGWGKPEEIKYLFPRVVEYQIIALIEDVLVNNLYLTCLSLNGNGLFKHGMNIEWSANEQQAIRTFWHALIDFMLHNAIDVYYFLDEMEDMEILQIMSSIAKEKGSDHLGEIFDAMSNDEKNQRRGLLSIDHDKLISMWEAVPHEHKEKQFKAYLDRNSSDVICRNDITDWVLSDKHMLEFDFMCTPPYSEMFLQNAIKSNKE